jgi:serine/threonine-protein kinase
MSYQNFSGHTIGQYELRELLGEGGMGAVYRGWQLNLHREVAVKVLTSALAERPDYLQRFEREARTAAGLEHPHIVPVYDYGTFDLSGIPVSYVVMRLLNGGSLGERIHHSRASDGVLPSLGEAAQVTRQIASALDYAHERGVIHRDIKPSNVMFDNRGTAFVVDFGIAKLVNTTTNLTGAGQLVGTPYYMAPELWRTDAVVPATDQYALAVVIYEMLTGHLPFEADQPFRLMRMHLDEAPTPIQQHRLEMPWQVGTVLEQALAKDPNERYASVMAFANAFDKAVEDSTRGNPSGFFTNPLPPKRQARPAANLPGTPTIPPGQSGSTPKPQTPPPATPPPPTEQLPGSGAQPPRRTPLIWGIAAALLVVLVGGGIFTAVQINEANKRIEETRIAGDIQASLIAQSARDTSTAQARASAEAATAQANTATAQAIANAEASATREALDATASAEAAATATEQFNDMRTAIAFGFTQTATLWTQTPTPTYTPSNTPTPTDTFTPSRTPTPTDTFTPSRTPTPTLTPSDTPTPTYTPSNTPTPTPTLTPSDTPTPTLTPSDTPTPTPTLTSSNTPTRTPTLTPTRTPTPTLTPTPSVDSDEPSSVVSALMNLGYIPETMTGEFGDDDSRIAIDLSNADNRVSWEVLGGNYTDFVISTNIEWGDGATEDTCGFFLRIDPNGPSGYTIEINRNGALTYNELNNEEWQGIVQGDGDNIATRRSESNRLMVVAINNRFDVFINNQFATTFRDSNATIRQGIVGVMASTFDESEETGCTFTNTWVWDLNPDAVLPTPTPTEERDLITVLQEGDAEESVNALAANGFLDEVSGELGAVVDEVEVDVSDQDNYVTWRNIEGAYRDFVMGATISWQTDDEGDSCGFNFRTISSDNLYTLHINRQGEVWFRELYRDQFRDSIFGEGDAINTGRRDSNHLLLIAVGDRFTVLINGEPAGEFEDATQVLGAVGILASTGENSDESICNYTNAWVWDLNPLPLITGSSPRNIMNALEDAGYIADAGGEVREEDNRITIDMTGDDNLMRPDLFDETYANFVIGTTIEWGDGAENDTCGVRFRSSDDHTDSYNLELNRLSTVRFTELNNGEWEPSVTGLGLTINTRRRDENTLILVAVEDAFTVFVNGQFAGQFFDSSFDEGLVGMIAATFEDSDEAGCIFSDTWVWELDD